MTGNHNVGNPTSAGRNSRYLNAIEVQQVEAAWRAGQSINEIALDFDVTPQCIWYHVEHIQRDNGPKTGPKRSFSYERAWELKEKHGMTQEAIAYRLGVSQMSVSRAIKAVRHAA